MPRAPRHGFLSPPTAQASPAWITWPFAAVVASACVVDTTPPAGALLLCGAGGSCPAGLTCAADNTCRDPSNLGVDGGDAGQNPDAGTPADAATGGDASSDAGSSGVSPTGLWFSGVRLTPYKPTPSHTMEAWPVALSNPTGASLTVSVRWLGFDGGLIREGASLTLDLGDAGQTAGSEVRAQITVSGGDASVTQTSCARIVAPPEATWWADRPPRATTQGANEPPPRTVLDMAAHRIVLIGSNTWEFDLERARTVTGVGTARPNESLRWRQLSPKVSWTDFPELAIDTDGQRLVSFGGTLSSLPLDRGCEAWATLTPTGTAPATLTDSTITPDPTRGRILVFGGIGDGGATKNLAAFKTKPKGAEAWQALAIDGGPSARGGHVSVLDTARDSLVVIGGVSCSGSCGTRTQQTDAHRLQLSDTVKWHAITTEGASPPAVYRAAAAYDPPRRRVLIWGGCADTACTQYKSELWSLTASADGGKDTWAQLSPGGTLPTAGPASAHYDAVTDAFIVVAVPSPNTSQITSGAPTLYSLPLDAGSLAFEETDPRPSARNAHGAALIDAGGIAGLVVYGGTEMTGLADNTVWLFDGVHWSRLGPSGTGPGQRAFMAFVSDRAGDIFLHGGENAASERQGDLWRLRLAGAAAWSQLSAANAPTARAGHGPASLIALQSDVAAYPLLRTVGGVDIEGRLIDGGADLILDGGATTWVRHTGTVPSARNLHASVYDAQSGRVLVIGGQGPNADLTDLWTSSASSTSSWTNEPMSTPLPGLSWHAAASIGPGRVAVYAGAGRQGELLLLCYDMFAMSPVKWSYKVVTPANVALCGAELPTANYDAPTDTLILYGGGNDRNCTAVWRLAPASSLECP